MVAEELRTIEEAVEPAAGRFAEMQAGHAGATAAATAGIEGTARLTGHEVLEEAVKRRLETA